MKLVTKIISGLFLRKSDHEQQSIQLWQPDTAYKAGDLVSTSNHKILKCREGSYADFCYLDPNSAGGKVAWTQNLSTDLTVSTTHKKVSCSSKGPFKTDHMYCFDDAHVWQCRTASNCNQSPPNNFTDPNFWNAWNLIDGRPSRLGSESSSQLLDLFS